MPLKNPPSWFISSLSFANNSTVICVDDSISIWHAWQERFTTVDGNIDLRYCSSKEELLYEIEKRNEKPCTYLVDYEFSGSGYTGLELVDIIQSLGIPNNRVFLVTSRSNEMEVQNLCKSREIYMIPKFLPLKWICRL
ncbi:MAG: hypothetical protein HWD59_15140 [Coxiellaceae bacterium]|nr:MAG: hypothetical protein HWD59_15140 [Coxiellaceae bacterium]